VSNYKLRDMKYLFFKEKITKIIITDFPDLYNKLKIIQVRHSLENKSAT
jgi:hypothetical protein